MEPLTRPEVSGTEILIMNRIPVKGWRITRMAAALALLFCARAQAHVFVVTDTNDTTSVTSLRGAVIAANADGGENTIILGEEFDPRRREPAPAWTFYLTIQGADEDAAQTGDLDVTSGKLTIIGATTNVTINAIGLGDRAFEVFSNASLNLENIIINGGGLPGLLPTSPPIGFFPGTVTSPGVGFSPGGPPSGGILNNGAMTMRNCIVVSNSTPTNEDGGGILNTGSLLMENCSVGNNIANGESGGGIFNTGSLELFHCDICRNFAVSGFGGAIYNNGRARLVGCVISSNIVDSVSAEGGGGIINDTSGTMDLSECAIKGNLSIGDGGGLYNAGALTLNNCVVSGNRCGFGPGTFGGSGGGISSLGEAAMNNCTISDNSAGSAIGPNSSGGNGGGINNLGNCSMRFCTVSGNIAGSITSVGVVILTPGTAGNGGNGGGIYSTNNFAMVCCTISGNSAGAGGVGPIIYSNSETSVNGGMGGDGGGIYTTGGCLLNSCTIVSNSAGTGGSGGLSAFGLQTNGSGGMGGNGGGVFSASPGLSASIENTVIALNMAGTGGAGGTNYAIPIEEPPPGLYQILPPGSAGLPGLGSDGYGAFTSQGFNLIGAADGSAGFANGIMADQAGTTNAPIDPVIGPLQMNGGRTATHALLPGSPAINKGFSFGVHRDQRGEYRPFEYPGVPYATGGDGSDIGAFELHLNERFGQRGERFEQR